MIKCLFFDFDGTISDAHNIAVKSLTKVLDEYEYTFDQNELLKSIGNKTEIILKELGVNPGHLDAIYNKFYKYFKEEALEGGIKPCVSLKPLKELSKKYPLIVISNSETSFLKASIKELKIDRLFKEIYGAEKFSTKDELLEKLFKKYKISPKEAIYIGDRFTDVDSAREAGCVAVAIHNKCSWSNLETIKNEKPDYIIKDFEELKKLVKNINKS